MLGSPSKNWLSFIGRCSLVIIAIIVIVLASVLPTSYSYSLRENNAVSTQHDPHHPTNSGHRHLRHDIAVIKPTFTIAAYQPHGFYDYYLGNCSAKCLTVSLHTQEQTGLMNYAGSRNTLRMIKERGIVDVVTDQRVTKDPSILTHYRKVIILHNEYVTQTEFDAITHHPNVLYLYPNALYALVSYNPKDATITLEKGHGFGGINNAFGWQPSMSTKDEYDTSCENWKLVRVSNGFTLNCYPEYRILHDEKLFAIIKS
jgi:hypothetical protein